MKRKKRGLGRLWWRRNKSSLHSLVLLPFDNELVGCVVSFVSCLSTHKPPASCSLACFRAALVYRDNRHAFPKSTYYPGVESFIFKYLVKFPNAFRYQLGNESNLEAMQPFGSSSSSSSMLLERIEATRAIEKTWLV